MTLKNNQPNTHESNSMYCQKKLTTVTAIVLLILSPPSKIDLKIFSEKYFCYSEDIFIFQQETFITKSINHWAQSSTDVFQY